MQERNPAVIRAYHKAGFKEIGRRRECRMMGGKLWDEVHMDCLSSEFESRVLRGSTHPATNRVLETAWPGRSFRAPAFVLPLATLYP